MQIIDLTAADSGRIEQVAALLIDAFSDTGRESWRSRDEAVLSVRESLQEGCISRVATDDSGRIAGCVAGRSMYEGRHPFEFYRKVGFVIVGLLPDANGYGKPDIFARKAQGAGRSF
jgi:hypothetical protein